MDRNIRVSFTPDEVQFLEKVLKMHYIPNTDIPKREQIKERKLKSDIEVKLNIWY